MSALGYEKFKKLNNLFGKEFDTQFKKVTYDGKNEIFMYFDNIYSLWYYSALFHEAFASPAIFADIWFKEGGVNVCVPKLKGSEYYFEWQLYNVNDHPFIKDLAALAEIADDMASFDRITHELIPADFEKYAHNFTLNDNIYISYLVEMALEMGLIKKLPSVHIVKYNSTAKGRSMEQLKGKAALEMAVECAAKIFCRKFSAVLGAPVGLNKNLVLKWLNNTYLTDDIYADIYDLVGIDIIDLWKNDRHKDDLDEIDRVALSSVYPIGRMIDRYFLTPYGRYMQLIQPIYYMPLSFEHELEYIFDSSVRDDFDNSTAAFAPSSMYRLTNIGKKILSHNKKEVPLNLSEIEMENYLAQLMKYYR